MHAIVLGSSNLCSARWLGRRHELRKASRLPESRYQPLFIRVPSMPFPYHTRLDQLETRVRNILVDAQGSARFSKRWFQIVAALDCVGDGVVALRDYEEYDFGERQGERYLRL